MYKMSQQQPQEARPQNNQQQPAQQKSRSKKPAESSVVTKKRKEEPQFHLKVVDRVLKWPVVDSAWNTSHHVYGKFKGLNVIFTVTCNLAEMSGQTVAQLSKPLVMVFEKPIHVVDNVLDKGLEKLETTVPIVKDPPMEILNKTHEIAMVFMQPPLDLTTRVLTLTKNQTNNILSTSYGNWAVTKIDEFSAGAEHFIDSICKLRGEGEDLKTSVKTPTEADPLMHVVETLGCLFGIVSRRVFVKLYG